MDEPRSIPGSRAGASPAGGASSDGAAPRCEPPASYLAEVERLFVEHTRCGLNLSGRDVALVRQWQAQGVPLEVVARGLDAALRKDPHKKGAPPRSLYFAREAIDEAMARHRRLYPSASLPATAAATRPPPPSAPEPATDPALVLFAALGRSRREPAVRQALREGYAELRRLAESPPRERWTRARALVFERLHSALRPWQRVELERALAAERTAGMSPTAAAAHRAALTERWLANELGLAALLSSEPPRHSDPGSRP